MKKYRAKVEDLAETMFEVHDGRVLLVCDNGARVDVTLMTLIGSGLTDPEMALIDLYTGEDSSIEEVTE